MQRLRTLLAATTLLLARLAAADPAPAPTPAAADLAALEQRVNDKERAGKEQPGDFTEEIKAFDALLAKYAGQTSEDVARIALAKAILVWDLGSPPAVVDAHFVRVTNGFPGTKSAATAARMRKNNQTLAGLEGQPAPEIHFTWSSAQPAFTTLSALRGQVVVLDFWATWCGPCVRAFPEMRATVARFAGAPVVFLGVTSIQGRIARLEAKPIDTKGHPEKEMALMPRFMQAKEMTWPVVFSAEDVFNPDYGVSGIPYVAIIGPDGIVRHAGLNPGDKHADIPGKIEALLRASHLPVPAAKG